MTPRNLLGHLEYWVLFSVIAILYPVASHENPNNFHRDETNSNGQKCFGPGVLDSCEFLKTRTSRILAPPYETAGPGVQPRPDKLVGCGCRWPALAVEDVETGSLYFHAVEQITEIKQNWYFFSIPWFIFFLLEVCLPVEFNENCSL